MIVHPPLFDLPLDLEGSDQVRGQIALRTSTRPTAARELPAEEVEFRLAMESYQQSSGRMFPTWSEVLEVIQGLGYAKPEGDKPPRALRSGPPALAEADRLRRTYGRRSRPAPARR